MRGWKKYRFISACAEGESNKNIAALLDISEKAAQNLRKVYESQINDKQQNMEDEFNGLWVARKAARIAQYQDYIERVDEFLDAVGVVGVDAPLIRAAQTSLNAVAEEMGQLTTRSKIELEGSRLEVTLNGVGVEDLT